MDIFDVAKDVYNVLKSDKVYKYKYFPLLGWKRELKDKPYRIDSTQIDTSEFVWVLHEKLKNTRLLSELTSVLPEYSLDEALDKVSYLLQSLSTMEDRIVL